MRTRVFRSGNSQAVRIPKELSFDPAVNEVEIERHAGGLLIRPVRRASFDGLDRVLAAFPAAFMADRPLPRDQGPRRWHDESGESR
jgi:antitoxin VapB